MGADERPAAPAADAPACRLCHVRDAELLFVKEGIDYLRCRACGFAFSAPPANPNLAADFASYEPAYRKYFDSAAEDELNLRDVWKWIEAQRPLAGARLLDVGAGSGKLVRFLRERGVDAHGIEPSPALHARFLASEPDVFSCDDLVSFARRRPPGSFDVATAFDVLEHVEDADAALAALAHLLAPGGRVFVATIDAASWPARLLGRRWHFYNRYHLSYWTRDSLVANAARHGLRLAGFRRPVRLHSLGYLVRYALEFVFRTPRAIPTGALDRVVVPVYVPDGLIASFVRIP